MAQGMLLIFLTVSLLSVHYRYRLSEELVSHIQETQIIPIIKTLQIENINVLGSALTMILVTMVFLAVIGSIHEGDENYETVPRRQLRSRWLNKMSFR